LAGVVFAFCTGSGVQEVIFSGLGFVVAARGGSPGCFLIIVFTFEKIRDAARFFILHPRNLLGSGIKKFNIFHVQNEKK